MQRKVTAQDPEGHRELRMHAAPVVMSARQRLSQQNWFVAQLLSVGNTVLVVCWLLGRF